MSVVHIANAQTKYPDNNIISVSAQEFNRLLSTGKYTLMDIRTPKEFEEGHILKAINVDFYSKDFQQSIEIYKDVPVLIYSRSSSQSKQALSKMADLNFKNVIELENGLVAWKREGFSLIK